jgi:sodium/potassium-transporting ATPase subunit alpha
MNSSIKKNKNAKYHLCSLDELFDHLDTSEKGLVAETVTKRLQEVGTNELRVKQDVPEIIKFLRQFKNFFALLLFAGSGLALFAEQLDPDVGNLYIAIALFAVTVLNATFTYIQEHQSEKIMESFRKLMPSMVRVYRDGTVVEVDASMIVPGDVIRLSEGDRVPADGRLLKDNLLRVNLSSLTGESEAVLLDSNHHHDNVLESHNMVFSGSLIESGESLVLVCATGMNTQIGKIVQLTKETKVVQTPIGKELNYFIRIISSIAIFLGVLFFIVSFAIGKGTISSLIFAIGIIVANVPEGLLPTVTLALAMASKRMASKNALIKNLESVETLGSSTVICTDKTGTLTQNKISVQTISFLNAEYQSNEITSDIKNLELSCQVMSLCNNAQVTDAGYIGESTEGALIVFANDQYGTENYNKSTRLAEKPFESSTRHMITVNHDPDLKNNQAYLKGAPEVVLSMCDRVLDGDIERPLDDETRQNLISKFNLLAKRGERGLALAYRETTNEDIVEDSYVFVAIVGMLDPYRPEVPDALSKCRTAGIRVFMMTGDYGPTAETIARQIGLYTGDGQVIQGEELDKMDDSALSKVLDNKELIFARISPQQKLQIVRALQAKNEIVTVTGDGVNDAPALKNADMGVAMGIMGTDVAKEASDMVLMDDNFATIVVAIEEGRTIFDNIKKFIAYILTSNIPEITPFIAYVLLDIPLPVTVVLILAIDLGTDLVPALGLGAEHPESDVMHKPPRSRKERLLTRNLLFMSYGIIGMIQAAAGFFSFFVVLYNGGWQYGQDLASNTFLYQQATTAFLASVVICQVADVLICRTRRQSLFSVGLLKNRLVLLGIATELSLVALISYAPWFNVLFNTAPLEYWHFLLSVPFALLIFFGDELRRFFVRRDNAFVLKWLTW